MELTAFFQASPVSSQHDADYFYFCKGIWSRSSVLLLLAAKGLLGNMRIEDFAFLD